VLNDHCSVCEYRQGCHQQAVQEDNLSLLRGMKEKEVKAYARKGILTVSQLAHTFRPRRSGKKTKHKDRHNYPLQALAIRTKRPTYSAPFNFSTPDSGLPRLGRQARGELHLLIGAIVETGGRRAGIPSGQMIAPARWKSSSNFLNSAAVRRFSRVLLRLLRTSFPARMAKQARNRHFAERILKNTFNILSVVYATSTFQWSRMGSRW